MQGAVRTSVTLLVQYIGNTVIFLVTFFQLCFAVFRGRISATYPVVNLKDLSPIQKGLLHIVQFALTSFTTFGPNRVLLLSDASHSHDSSVYRPNAFKTSSVVIRAEGNATRDEGPEWSGP